MVHIEVKTNKTEVQRFLYILTETLNSPEFDPSSDFIFIPTNKNQQTLADLEYDIEQVIENLRTLTVEEYSETKLDNDNAYPPFLRVFGRVINQRLIYIKIKIREREEL